ncbi:DNA-directed RNA polymerase subunit alpha [Spirochaetia bacterium]|nr:DNA-directed RNA polymerase subunit alpha [Spirochaetia bacterium]GHU34958.1 DNA-directed RNA polymerase subunit alpha [Spirochaetia bacterium]
MTRPNLLKGFKCPKGIRYEYGELKPDYGKFIAEPFETGFATTIGNTLRRVLLSSIQGYAITGIRVTSFNSEGNSHVISNEFEIIPDVVEDTLEVINNLKQIRFRLLNDAEQGVIRYEWSNKREICSDDFASINQLEVMSNGQHIMTLMDGAHLEFEIQVELGRGFVPAEVNEKYIEVIGTIPVDAIFTPVKKVKYSVEPTRVGQRSDYDKLVLEIWTDGTIGPQDALGEAAKIAKDYFSVFINFDETNIGFDEPFNEDNEQVRQILNTPVEEMELSVRSYNCLRNANIRTIGELTRKTEDDIAKTRNFGKKSLDEIKTKLKEWNLNLGITDLSAFKNVVRTPGVGITQKEPEDESVSGS